MALVKNISSLNVRPSTKSEIYSDFYTNFDKHPDKMDIVKYSNEDSIKRSIKNILLTNRGEKLFNPSFGGNIRHLLFENVTPVTESLLRSYIETAINNFEPRARIIDVITSASPDENAYDVTIIFSAINTTEPITLNLILNRVR